MATQCKAHLFAGLIAAQLCGSFACSGYDSELLPPSEKSSDVVSAEADGGDTLTSGVQQEPSSEPSSTPKPLPTPTPAPLRRDGADCSAHAQCASQHCDNGWCCSEGRCCNQADDCVLNEIVRVCVDAATCQGVRHEFACTEHRCEADDRDDDSACDATLEASACDLYVSVTCTGKAEQAAPGCRDGCKDDSACDPGAHCSDKKCVPDAADGERCNDDAGCTRGHCGGGFCCAQGDCCKTASDCPDGYGGGATCENSNECQGTRKAAQCEGSICGSHQVDDDSACGRDTLASSCDAAADVYCAGGSSQSAPECARSCSREADCDADAHCSNGSCQRDQPNGADCDGNNECASQYCNSGTCCNAGNCCNADSDCPSSYSCVDAGTCQGVVQERTCTDFQCQDGARRADASGCVGQLARSCGAYRDVYCGAGPTARACGTSCSTGWECNFGYSCSDGSCSVP